MSPQVSQKDGEEGHRQHGVVERDDRNPVPKVTTASARDDGTSQAAHRTTHTPYANTHRQQATDTQTNAVQGDRPL